MNEKQHLTVTPSETAGFPRAVKRFVSWFVASAILLLGLSWFFFDEVLADSVPNWLKDSESNPTAYSVAILLVLASDLLLPIPSSALITHAGSELGTLSGTLVGFLGISLGSVIGFALARALGNSFIQERVNEKDRTALAGLADQYGMYMIVLLRPVPILAEASVLLMGAGQMSWRSFLFWLAISNFCVAFFFAAFGQWAVDNGIGEMPALLISIILPALLLVSARLILKGKFTD